MLFATILSLVGLANGAAISSGGTALTSSYTTPSRWLSSTRTSNDFGGTRSVQRNVGRFAQASAMTFASQPTNVGNIPWEPISRTNTGRFLEGVVQASAMTSAAQADDIDVYEPISTFNTHWLLARATQASTVTSIKTSDIDPIVWESSSRVTGRFLANVAQASPTTDPAQPPANMAIPTNGGDTRSNPGPPYVHRREDTRQTAAPTDRAMPTQRGPTRSNPGPYIEERQDSLPTSTTLTTESTSTPYTPSYTTTCHGGRHYCGVSNFATPSPTTTTTTTTTESTSTSEPPYTPTYTTTYLGGRHDCPVSAFAAKTIQNNGGRSQRWVARQANITGAVTATPVNAIPVPKCSFNLSEGQYVCPTLMPVVPICSFDLEKGEYVCPTPTPNAGSIPPPEFFSTRTEFPTSTQNARSIPLPEHSSRTACPNGWCSHPTPSAITLQIVRKA
ncbi:hypothetical protein CC86DRAFT_461038 [Ophiobolus disseminans]|uniref:Uncharacterized protein n=1 Tax=Ophiobolus disseminans TaxID=1469910 RepID=A0A6A6ZCZ0_9PLEO|nr:hypothetical protein CC86DRAFT_461038 [Ophiobolus disseminans]